MPARRLQPQWEPRIVVSEHQISPIHSGSAGSRGRGGRSEGWRRWLRSHTHPHDPHTAPAAQPPATAGRSCTGGGALHTWGRGIADREGNRSRASPARPELRRGWTVVGSAVSEGGGGDSDSTGTPPAAPTHPWAHHTVTSPRIPARRQSRRETRCADQGWATPKAAAPHEQVAGGRRGGNTSHTGTQVVGGVGGAAPGSAPHRSATREVRPAQDHRAALRGCGRPLERRTGFSESELGCPSHGLMENPRVCWGATERAVRARPRLPHNAVGSGRIVPRITT